LAKEIVQLEKKMLEFARNLEFEKAAKARDELSRLKQKAFGAGALRDQVEVPSGADVMQVPSSGMRAA
jgi:excinuclease UvrABC nuclease subunit